MSSIPISEEQHSKAWLIKIRMKAKTFDEVVDAAFIALAKERGWTDLEKKEER